jgi:ABC-type polysaccharide/polyol phosphate export permease
MNGFAPALPEVWRSFRMWRIWVRLGVQDVRLRFRRSVIGVGWIFLNLAVMILAIGYVYGHLFGQDLSTFIPYLTASLVTWGYLTNSIVEGGSAFIASEGYIKQISLPIYVYIFRFFVSIGLTAGISAGAFLLVIVLYHVPLHAGTLWVVPGILLLMVSSLLLIVIQAHVNARFRDAANLSGVVMQVAFYVTPVMFPAELLQSRGLRAIVQLNPLYHLLEVVRHPLLHGESAQPQSYGAVLLVILVLTAAATALVKGLGRRIVFWL